MASIGGPQAEQWEDQIIGKLADEVTVPGVALRVPVGITHLVQCKGIDGGDIYEIEKHNQGPASGDAGNIIYAAHLVDSVYATLGLVVVEYYFRF